MSTSPDPPSTPSTQQTDVQPLLTNARACREWDWIVRQVGLERALEALRHLGYRKPYPLNAARRLGLQIPAVLAKEPEMPQKPPPIPPEIQQRLDALANKLKRNSS
ncbi:MAG TPA: hypothetical protein PKE37_16835 [Thiomonas arsenitoxydans]|uniref:hypothetical protein n=1 Tax=Thiomonas arsenitoxydans (strain DSM 22701 / CIP 110005 / 3As) TaxID=426114 RepID=UPI002CE55E19|nr:hypothetical protein [Thiomonas arsenitoxydans]HML83418.1 hypothetical protein [Thiomonas arsenitoxydans]